MSDPATHWHVGRAWTGHDIEDACPCPQEACGLVSEFLPECEQHGIGFAKSIRQTHRADHCPGAS